MSWYTYFKGQILKRTLVSDNICRLGSLKLICPQNTWRSRVSFAQWRKDERGHGSCFKGLKTHHIEEEAYSAALQSAKRWPKWRSDCHWEFANIEMAALWSGEPLERILEGWDAWERKLLGSNSCIILVNIYWAPICFTYFISFNPYENLRKQIQLLYKTKKLRDNKIK